MLQKIPGPKEIQLLYIPMLKYWAVFTHCNFSQHANRTCWTLDCHCFEQPIVSVVWFVLALLQTINHRTVVLFIYKSNWIGFCPSSTSKKPIWKPRPETPQFVFIKLFFFKSSFNLKTSSQFERKFIKFGKKVHHCQKSSLILIFLHKFVKNFIDLERSS